MGEYIDGYKLGTCESMYYVRFSDLPKFGKPGIRYLTDHVSRGRFPFPDEDDLFSPHTGKIVSWDEFDEFGFDRGVAVPSTGSFWRDMERADEAGEATGHYDDCRWVERDDDSLQVVSQKLVATEEKGEQIWTVVRCPHCGAMWRLSEEDGLALVADIRQAVLDGTVLPKDAPFMREMARRIEVGYRVPDLVEKLVDGENPFAPLPYQVNDVVVPTRPFGDLVIGIVTEVEQRFAPDYIRLAVVAQNGHLYRMTGDEVRRVLDFGKVAETGC